MIDLSGTDLAEAGATIIWSWWTARWVFQMFGGEEGQHPQPDKIEITIKHEYPEPDDD